ncbi:MAG: threonine/serine dehydratase [Alphaproteobacteria bacterium]|nr:threonine/serine dehydratase [Alphaproteobacteria bacterium]MBL7099111.1 threonine/serine dehydratase [Alphaproteobacteria bacterium]
MSITVPTFADVEAAAERIRPYATRTRLIESHDLNARLGARVFLKPEMFQRTGSFKFRGACNAVLQIPQARRANGVIAFSSGNHAQGVAAAAREFGLPATIVMPKDAPATKIAGTRRLGADVVFYDRRTDDREAIARDLMAKSGATLIEPFDNAKVVAGQGTAGLEIVDDMAALGMTLDTVLAPCGGGGLVTGIALAFAGRSPKTRVIGVEPERFDGMRLSLAAGARTPAPGGELSIADALMAPAPGHIPFAIAKEKLSAAVAVTDTELQRAVSYAFQRLKVVVEPGSAAGLAALLAGKVDVGGRRHIAVVLTGGNCEISTVASCVVAVTEP